MPRARILLADDHVLTLEGLRTVLAPHHEIVGAASDGRAVVDAALRLDPEVVVLDISMPLLNGIDAAVQIHKSLPGTKFVFVTMHPGASYVEAAFQAGASGYVLKSAAREELLDAIEAVRRGRVYLSRSLVQEGPKHLVPGAPVRAPHLSGRERENLQLIAEGKAAKEIASILNVAIKTVDFHRDNIKRKLGLRTTAELTRYAIEHGLISVDSPSDIAKGAA